MTRAAWLPVDLSFTVTGIPPILFSTFSASVNGVAVDTGCSCPTTDGSGSTGSPKSTHLAVGAIILITAGKTVMVVVTFHTYAANGRP